MSLLEGEPDKINIENSTNPGLKSSIPAGFLGKLTWQYVTTIWSVVAGFCYSLLLARSLGASEFGLFSLSIGFAIIVFQIFELRLNEAVVRYVSEFLEHKDTPRMLATIKLSLIADVLSGFSALVVVIVLMPLASRFLINDERSFQLLLLAGVTVFFSNVSTATALGILRAFGQFKVQSLVTVTFTSLKLLATYGAITWLGCGVIGVMMVGIISSFFMNAVMISIALRHVSRQFQWPQYLPVGLLKSRMNEMSRFVASTYLFSLSSIPTKELDVVLLGFFMPAYVVGVYKMAKNFIAAMWAVSDPIFFVVYPELSRLWVQMKFDLIRHFLKRLTLVLAAAGILVYLGAVIFVPIIMNYTLGQEYAEAASIFRWMAWFILLWMPFLWINPLLLAATKPNLMLKATLVGSSFVLILYFALIPQWGAKGAALAYAFGTPFGLVFSFLFAFRGGVLQRLFRIDSAIRPFILKSDDGKNVKCQWEKYTSLPFAARDGAGLVVFKNQIWLIGGYNNLDKANFPRITSNDVWSSCDGLTWSCEKPNTFGKDSFDPASDWEGRHVSGCVVFNDHIWLVGGDCNQGHYQNDVWCSQDGVTWRCATRKVPWPPRGLHNTFVFKGRLFVMGGQTLPQFVATHDKTKIFNDIWSSSDGVNWRKELIKGLLWPARSMIVNSAIFKDRIWVAGGGIYQTQDIRRRSYFNDVWSSSDGINWEQHLKHAPWSGRVFHAMVVFDDKLWIIGGCDKNDMNDVWYSHDGLVWHELSGSPLPYQHAVSTVVFNNSLYIACGSAFKDELWQLKIES